MGDGMPKEVCDPVKAVGVMARFIVGDVVSGQTNRRQGLGQC